MGINNPGGHVRWETETYKALENRREELDRTAEDQINDIREMRDLFKINDSPEEELKKAIKKIKAWIKQWHKEKIKTPSEIESFGLNQEEISEREIIRDKAGYQIQELEDVLNEFQTSLGGIDQGELIPSPASAPPPEAVPQTRKKLTWQKSQVSLARLILELNTHQFLNIGDAHFKWITESFNRVDPRDGQTIPINLKSLTQEIYELKERVKDTTRQGELYRGETEIKNIIEQLEDLEKWLKDDQMHGKGT